jgi:hypothetical protein
MKIRGSDPSGALTPAITERDDRVLRVVYASVEPPRIVTVDFDRRQRGKP